MAYYFDVETLARITELVVASTVIGAHVVGVHWRGSDQLPAYGRRGARRSSTRSTALALIVHHVEDDFVLDVWERLA